jgi:hypothetical protein
MRRRLYFPATNAQRFGTGIMAEDMAMVPTLILEMTERKLARALVGLLKSLRELSWVALHE